ncbi:integrase core domain protein [Mycobacterium kansasii]|uniref:Integrase core domain protein n=1 Tax=Mycobacterium kansasii TaxID=1768 RepID=A0A1V3WCY1_MYCKA|nr:integrase core domain protein [Mycobacterium kansasii]
MDFQFDSTTDGRPFKIVSIIDEYTRECLGDKVDRSITGEDLIDELDRIAAQRGTYPNVLRCDNGPELACAAMADWADGHVGLHFIPPGEPWRNGYVESFNSRIRDECLNINSFWSLAQARVVISDWKHDYNHHRRHSALGYQAPPTTLPPAPTNERLSFAVDQFTGPVNLPTFSAGIVISGPKPTPRMVFGVAAQPGPQAGIGVLGSLGGGFVALGGRCCPVTRQANRSLTPSTRWR